MGSTSPPIPRGSTAPSSAFAAGGGGNMRVFMDDDEESFFELDLGAMGSSSPPLGIIDFPIHIALSPLPTAGDLFSDGIILPLQALDTTPPPTPPPQSILAVGEPSNTQSSLSRRFGFRGGRGSSSSRSHDEAAAKARSAGRSRPPSRTTAAITATTAAAAGVLKFLVKFPSEKLRRAFLAVATRSRPKPLVAPPDKHRPSPPEPPGTRRPLGRTLLVPFRRLFVERKASHTDERPRVVDIGSDHSGFMKALAEAMDVKGAGRRKGGLYDWQRPVSAPSSLQSSPRHSWSASAEGEEATEKKRRKKKVATTTTTKVRREGSITSAIAHCKGVDSN